MEDMTEVLQGTEKMIRDSEVKQALVQSGN